MRVSDTKPVSIGRDTGRLRLRDSRVSKRHAQVAFEDGLWVIRDMGSSNGTYVNHQRVEGVIVLETDDLIQIGRITVKVLRADEIGMDITPGLSEVELPDPIQEVEAPSDESAAFMTEDEDDDEDQISLSDEPFDIDAAFDDLAEGLNDESGPR